MRCTHGLRMVAFRVIRGFGGAWSGGASVEWNNFTVAANDPWLLR